MNNQDFDVRKYVDSMALLLNLDLDEYRDEVVANFETIMTIATLVNEFPLPDNVEIAPIFQP